MCIRDRFNELEKAERNAAYLGKLERGLEQVRAGFGIVKTMEELEAMAGDGTSVSYTHLDVYKRQMAHSITFSPDAWADYLYWQSEDKKTLKRINKLLQELQRDGAVQGLSLIHI